ncbi:hypothetical protein H0H87_007824, partial [Tephrocybe sp. NHM501043]
MPPADINPTVQPTVAPNGKKPLPKRLLDRFKPREGSSAAGAPAIQSREIPTALDVKPSALRRLSGVFKPTKSTIAISPPTTPPGGNLATPSGAPAHLAPDVLGVATASTVPKDTANAKVATTMVLAVNINPDSSTVSAARLAPNIPGAATATTVPKRTLTTQVAT